MQSRAKWHLFSNPLTFKNSMYYIVLCPADICYTKNDAYDIVDRDQQCHSSEEAKKVIYEEVSKAC